MDDQEYPRIGVARAIVCAPASAEFIDWLRDMHDLVMIVDEDIYDSMGDGAELLSRFGRMRGVVHISRSTDITPDDLVSVTISGNQS